MNIHEYQAKGLLSKFGVAVPRGSVAFTPEEAENAARELGGPIWVVKSQIHAGGRGAGRFKDDPKGAGGVRLCRSLDEVKENARKMLGHVLVTKQTGADGKAVKRLYIEDGCDIARELYLGMLIDRGSSRITLMASTEGGMEIEEVAARTPEKILKVVIDPVTGLMPYHGRKIAFGLGLEGKSVNTAVKFLMAMYRAFTELDASIVEINPLVITGAGEVIALDAKMNFDDNALYRHKDVAGMRDEDEEDPMELEAARHELNYIKLDGSIGCMVNGAGLAMATMDIIKLYGGEPANFLDVGGSASQEAVANAFRILVSDENVDAVLINIFGGIARTDRIARGVVGALEELGGVDLAVVVRLEGTNVEEGRRILREAPFEFIVAEHMADAAEKVVHASTQGARRGGE
jgi:succinyl-CoA synthetase beta subunit